MKFSHVATAILITAATLVVGIPTADAGKRHKHRIVIKPRPTVKHTIVIGGRPAAVVDVDVEPEDTKVFVDGVYRGTADELDGMPKKLVLKPGKHKITLRTPDGITVTKKVKLKGGTELELNLDLD